MLASRNPFVGDNGYGDPVDVLLVVMRVSQMKKTVNLLSPNPPGKILKPYL